jgi:hypothetical protein
MRSRHIAATTVNFGFALDKQRAGSSGKFGIPGKFNLTSRAKPEKDGIVWFARD